MVMKSSPPPLSIRWVWNATESLLLMFLLMIMILVVCDSTVSSNDAIIMASSSIPAVVSKSSSTTATTTTFTDRTTATVATTKTTTLSHPAPNQAPLALPPSSPFQDFNKMKHLQQPLHVTAKTAGASSNNVNDNRSNCNSDSSTLTPRPTKTEKNRWFSLLQPLQRRHHNHNRKTTTSSLMVLLRSFPFLAMIVSYITFPGTARVFHGLMMTFMANGQQQVHAASASTSTSTSPNSFRKVQLQAHVMSQILNGPVIAFLSILFGTISSMIIYILHQRQVTIRQCWNNELQAVQILQSILLQNVVQPSSQSQQLQQAQQYLKQYLSEEFDTCRNQKLRMSSSSWSAPAPSLLALLTWCHHHQQQQHQPPAQSTIPPSPPTSLSLSSTPILSDITTQATPSQQPLSSLSSQSSISLLMHHNSNVITDWVYRIWTERSNRHLAMASFTKPSLSYLTISLIILATGISISFLLSIDPSTIGIVLYDNVRDELPAAVRIVWTILMGSLTAVFTAIVATVLVVDSYDVSSSTNHTTQLSL